MTEPTRDENEVVENPPEQQTPPEAAGPAERRRGSGLAGTVSVLALLVAAASAAAAYYVWNQDQARLAALSAQVEALSGEFATLDDNATIQALRRELRIETQALGDTEQQLGQRLDTVESAIQGMQDLTLRGQRGWRIAEVEYLMRIATHRLRLMRDVDGATAALEGADDGLRQLADPSLLPVREALADEIQTLQNFAQPDTVGIALRLDRMISGLKPLPLAIPELETPVQTATAATGQGKSWTDFLHTIWQGLSSQVTVRHHGEPVQGLPDTQTELHIQQMLRLRLEAARLSVLRLDDAEYHRQLAAARGWVDENFRGEEAQALSAQIDELNAVDLRPALPDITASLTLLRQLANRPKVEVEAPQR